MPNFGSTSIPVPDPFETGICPCCGSCGVLLIYGGRCFDPFHDITIIAAMEDELSGDLANLPVYTKD